MSPLASAERTSVSGTFSPRCTRRTKGLLASNETGFKVSGMTGAPMESSINHIHLLLARQAHEVHRVSRDANGKVRVLRGIIHCFQQRFTIENIDVHVVT